MVTSYRPIRVLMDSLTMVWDDDKYRPVRADECLTARESRSGKTVYVFGIPLNAIVLRRADVWLTGGDHEHVGGVFDSAGGTFVFRSPDASESARARLLKRLDQYVANWNLWCPQVRSIREFAEKLIEETLKCDAECSRGRELAPLIARYVARLLIHRVTSAHGEFVIRYPDRESAQRELCNRAASWRPNCVLACNDCGPVVTAWWINGQPAVATITAWSDPSIVAVPIPESALTRELLERLANDPLDYEPSAVVERVNRAVTQ